MGLKRLAYFVVGGLGNWQPRLAFRETYSVDANNASQTMLHVEVWYEFDEDGIGWPASEGLHKASKQRWERWYRTNAGYAQTVEAILSGITPNVTALGKGNLQSMPDASYWLDFVLAYDVGGDTT